MKRLQVVSVFSGQEGQRPGVGRGMVPDRCDPGLYGMGDTGPRVLGRELQSRQGSTESYFFP